MIRSVALGAGLLAVVLGAAIGGLSVRANRAATALEVPDGLDVPLPTGAELAERLAPYLALDTQNPARPTSWAMVDLPLAKDAPEGAVPDQRPAWVDWLDRRYLTPLGVRWEMLEGALVVHVDGAEQGPPVLLLSHVDVVPVDEAEATTWAHPPFEPVVEDGYLWGRGALDNKTSTVLQLEALAGLKAAGRTPRRSLVLVVTPDEETSGHTAKALATDHLADLGNPTAVVDEGSFVLPDFVGDLKVGAVAVGEKAFVNLELSVTGESGHSSMPTGDAPLDHLVRALDRLSTWDTPDGLNPALQETLRRLAPHRPWPESMVMGNPDLFESVLLGIVQASPGGNAATRDTVALTIVEAGVKDNVVPSEAHATVNARLLPSTDPDTFLAAVRARIDDPRVTVEMASWPTVSTLGSWESDTFHALGTALTAIVPDVIVAPIVTPGTMDARYFGAQGLDTYRIHPFVLPSEERQRLHGRDERISLEDLGRGVRFYGVLFQVL